VGSAPNRSLTGPAARAGRGTESIVGPGEDVDRAVATLAARMEAPLVTALSVSGDALVEHAPARLPDLFGAGPALVGLKVRPEGGTLRVTGKAPAGPFERTVPVPPSEAASGSAAIAALFGREAVEDLEARLAAGEDPRGIDAAVEALGLDHQISTRRTSWVAVSEEPSVDPTRPTRRVTVPQALPHGMSIERLGLRAVARAPGVFKMENRAYALLPSPPLDVAEVRSSAESSAIEAFARVARERAALGAGPGSGGIPEEPGAEALHLAGRVVLDLPGELVVEITLAADLDWSPPPHAILLLRGGARVEAALDLSRTTSAGALASGQTLRLVLRYDASRTLGESVAAIALELAGEPLAVELAG
jgi:Ca-activated chloride channel family protein